MFKRKTQRVKRAPDNFYIRHGRNALWNPWDRIEGMDKDLRAVEDRLAEVEDRLKQMHRLHLLRYLEGHGVDVQGDPMWGLPRHRDSDGVLSIALPEGFEWVHEVEPMYELSDTPEFHVSTYYRHMREVRRPPEYVGDYSLLKLLDPEGNVMAMAKSSGKLRREVEPFTRAEIEIACENALDRVLPPKPGESFAPEGVIGGDSL